MSTPKAGQEAQRREQLEKLQAQEADLARQTSQSTGGRFSADPWVEVEAVRKAIPLDGLMIDLARFDVFDFQAKGTQPRFSPAHYAAWVVPAGSKGDIQIVDLGAAADIDRAVDAYRNEIQRDGR